MVLVWLGYLNSLKFKVWATIGTWYIIGRLGFQMKGPYGLSMGPSSGTLISMCQYGPILWANDLVCIEIVPKKKLHWKGAYHVVPFGTGVLSIAHGVE